LTPEGKGIATRAFLLCLWGTLLVFALIVAGILAGHDGMMIVAGVAAISGMVAGVSGFTIGRILPPR